MLSSNIFLLQNNWKVLHKCWLPLWTIHHIPDVSLWAAFIAEHWKKVWISLWQNVMVRWWSLKLKKYIHSKDWDVKKPMLYHRAISAPLSVWTVLKSEIQSAITKNRNPCHPLPSTNLPWVCYSLSMTLLSSVKKVNLWPRATSTTVWWRNWIKTWHCAFAKANWKTVNG